MFFKKQNFKAVIKLLQPRLDLGVDTGKLIDDSTLTANWLELYAFSRKQSDSTLRTQPSTFRALFKRRRSMYSERASTFLDI